MCEFCEFSNVDLRWKAFLSAKGSRKLDFSTIGMYCEDDLMQLVLKDIISVAAPLSEFEQDGEFFLSIVVVLQLSKKPQEIIEETYEKVEKVGGDQNCIPIFKNYKKPAGGDSAFSNAAFDTKDKIAQSRISQFFSIRLILSEFSDAISNIFKIFWISNILANTCIWFDFVPERILQVEWISKGRVKGEIFGEYKDSNIS
ncbi:unnamed protein product [Caenorhabditis angaria]|uniref:Uncharacterized protein n=1 Tax=Caenorhabditis angaria TaxID=860376 RepID=A0A9P1IWX1_9PELO|nr:unnamed protein product [Caenorhabditis angaria]